MGPKTITEGGETLTVRQWAVKLDVTLATVYGHLHRGKGMGALVASRRNKAGGELPPPRNHALGDAIGSVDDWAYRLQMPFETLDRQLRRGMSLADVVAQRQEHVGAGRLQLHRVGDEEMTAQQWADTLGTTYAKLATYAYRGRTMAQIVQAHRGGKLLRSGQKKAPKPKLELPLPTPPPVKEASPATFPPPAQNDQANVFPSWPVLLQPVPLYLIVDLQGTASWSTVAPPPPAAPTVQDMAPSHASPAYDDRVPPYAGALFAPAPTTPSFTFSPDAWPGYVEDDPLRFWG